MHVRAWCGLLGLIIAPNFYAGRRKGTMPAHIPEMVMRNDNRATRITVPMPQPQQAADEYRMNGGRITDPDTCSTFKDPLLHDAAKVDIRLHAFLKRYPSFDTIFHNLVNGNKIMFKEALMFFIDINFRLTVS